MSTSVYEALKYSKGSFDFVGDPLIVEEAIQININNSPYTVTMQMPGNERELIRGLLFTEDIYRVKDGPFDLQTIQKNDKGATVSVNIDISEQNLGKGYLNSRNILSVSSCGICGKRELDDLKVDGERLLEKNRIHPQKLEAMFNQMNEHQAAFIETGGSHAAAAFLLDGTLLSVMEDIGRHNAVDKVIGDLLLKKQLQKAKCLLVSGRISYEIVTKAFMAGIPFLAAVSAPSSLAVDFAKELGITLFGFSRGSKTTCYANHQKVITEPTKEIK